VTVCMALVGTMRLFPHAAKAQQRLVHQ